MGRKSFCDFITNMLMQKIARPKPGDAQYKKISISCRTSRGIGPGKILYTHHS